MSKESLDPRRKEPIFQWKIDQSSVHKIDIRLHKENDFRSIGEISFAIRQMKKLDPKIYGRHVNDPYPYPLPDFLERLRQSDSGGSKLAVKAMETKPNTVAFVGMWKINDEARGNLSVVRQMLKLALPEFRKYDVEYLVGYYSPQNGDGLSVAPYAKEMYEKLAVLTGGEVHSNGNVWVSVKGLEKWLGKSKD